METGHLRLLNAERRARRAAILATDLSSGAGWIIREGETCPEDIAAAVLQAFRSGKSVTVEAGGRSVFLNVHVPPPRLVVIGAVHISQALAPMAAVAGYDMEIIDPRTAFATKERFPGVPVHADWPEMVLAARPLDPYCAVAALTHDPKVDDHGLIAALSAGCFYVGALGSRKTHSRRLDRLAAAGVAADDLARIRAPIGLPIHASSPAEIAVAVLGEVIDAFRTRGELKAVP